MLLLVHVSYVHYLYTRRTLFILFRNPRYPPLSPPPPPQSRRGASEIRLVSNQTSHSNRTVMLSLLVGIWMSAKRPTKLGHHFSTSEQLFPNLQRNSCNFHRLHVVRVISNSYICCLEALVHMPIFQSVTVLSRRLLMFMLYNWFLNFIELRP